MFWPTRDSQSLCWRGAWSGDGSSVASNFCDGEHGVLDLWTEVGMTQFCRTQL